MAEPRRRVALISHSMPPAASGQAVMLGRLLEGADPDSVVLLSREGAGAGHAGPFARHCLPRLRQLPMHDASWLFSGSVAANAGWGIFRRAGQLAEILHAERCDVVVACTGDLHDIPAAALASRRLGLPFVPYLFDDYAYQWTGPRRLIARRLEAAVMPRASAIIVPNEALREEYQRRLGVDSVVVHNPCVLPDLDALDRAATRVRGQQATIVYAGAIYHAHYDAFRNLIRALGVLSPSRVRLVLYTAQPRRELEDGGLLGEGVELHPYLDEDALRGVLRQADILFLPLAFESTIPEVIRTSAPGKMGDYLSVGRPILAHAPADAFVSRFLTEHEAGLVVSERDPMRLATAVRRLLDEPALVQALGARGRALAEREFEVGQMRRRFFGVLDSVEARAA